MKFENILELIKAVSDSGLTNFNYEENDVKLHLEKKKEKLRISASDRVSAGLAAVSAGTGELADSPMSTAAGSTAAAAESAGGAELSGNIVKSPLVGTFYTAPAEDAPAFVQVGDTVQSGQTLGIVEAMKLMNEIASDFDGVVREILVENGAMVEYGQPLFRIG